ncbi:MAG: alpha/beta hydrolase-fold protein [Aestuariibaculum sp.]
MKYYIAFILTFIYLIGHTQKESYTAIIKAAEQENSKDSTHHKLALNLYSKAFTTYPEYVTENDLYWASVLAASLKENDLAFKYLTPLAKLEKDTYGFPGWDLIVVEYAEDDYQNLFDDSRWNILKTQALKEKEAFYKRLNENEAEFYHINTKNLSETKNAKTLYHKIKAYHPYTEKKYRDYSISFNINDSIKTSFFIHLPQDYNPTKTYPLLFFLHGAVKDNKLANYQTSELNLGEWNRYYTKYANKNDVILVFPRGNKQYNWMYPDDGFFMLPEMLKLIKKAININDNKVFISGHSNGATGSFSYVMKHPSPFAGFYGFNTYPKVFTGGTFVENIKNRSFLSFTTDKDYYYPPNANDSLTQLMKKLKADYTEYRYNGFPHWFPEFDESEPAYKILFNDLMAKERNPFPEKICWEFDNEKYGTIDWLNHITLDTLKPKANWHRIFNFKIKKWLKPNNNNDYIEQDVNKTAFYFPRKSGKIEAQYHDNIFRIETSCIKSFSLNISPEMVNVKKKIKVYANGKLKFNGKVKYNRTFILQFFEKNRDRKQVWINQINIDI